MTSELRKRLDRLKGIALLSMREQTGPCHLADWWDNFIGSIPQNAAFTDLDRETQQLIRAWEKGKSAQNDEDSL